MKKLFYRNLVFVFRLYGATVVEYCFCLSSKVQLSEGWNWFELVALLFLLVDLVLSTRS